jgi:hypothetical protein
MRLCVETKLSNTGMHGFKNWEQKGSEKETKKHWLENYVCANSY